MATFGVICLIALIGAGVYYYFYTQGKINDRDGDYIPDEIEDAITDNLTKGWGRHGLIVQDLLRKILKLVCIEKCYH